MTDPSVSAYVHHTTYQTSKLLFYFSEMLAHSRGQYTPAHINRCSKMSGNLGKEYDRLFNLENDVLWYKWADGPLKKLKLVVSQCRRTEILHTCHDAKIAGHLGVDKNVIRIRQSFYWPDVYTDAKKYVLSCTHNKKAPMNPRAGMKLCHAGMPMERVHIDVVEPFPISDRGNLLS